MDAPHLYELPNWFDYLATVLWAASGAFFAARRGFDITGIVFFSIVACTGGGVLRDGVFLNHGPIAVLREPVYILIPLAISALVWLGGQRVAPLAESSTLNNAIDAIGTGGFALFGLQLALQAEVSIPGALVVAVFNGVGGALIRDVVANRVPEFVQPGVLYGLAALAACIVFLLLAGPVRMPATAAGVVALAVMVGIRLAAVRFDLETRPVPWLPAQTGEPGT
jgi:uncharacterized membrane protein YeiH